MQDFYAAPIQAELITARLDQIRESRSHRRRCSDTAADPAVLQDRHRCRSRHLRHPRHHGLGRACASHTEPLNLKQFIYELERPPSSSAVPPPTPQPCTSCAPALPACSSASAGERPRQPARPWASMLRWPPRSPMSTPHGVTTWTNPAAATSTSSPMAELGYQRRDRQGLRRRRRCRHARHRPGPFDPEAPGRGMHWGAEAHHPRACREAPCGTGTRGQSEQVPVGPGRTAIGELNLAGALRRALATTGYVDLKEFQRVDVHRLALSAWIGGLICSAWR